MQDSGGGGGGGALAPNFSRYICATQSGKWGALEQIEREKAGIRSGLKREMGVSGADL